MADSGENQRERRYLRASLGDLFRAATPPACDACGEELPLEGADDDDGAFTVRGKGMYVSSRGEEVRYEDVPLCPSCGSAIALAARMRWEIEEEEG